LMHLLNMSRYRVKDMHFTKNVLCSFVLFFWVNVLQLWDEVSGYTRCFLTLASCRSLLWLCYSSMYPSSFSFNTVWMPSPVHRHHSGRILQTNKVQ
jgi:hypothetical protein